VRRTRELRKNRTLYGKSKMIQILDWPTQSPDANPTKNV